MTEQPSSVQAKVGTRQPRKQIVMKCGDRLTVEETGWLVELLSLRTEPRSKSALAKRHELKLST